MIDMRMGEKDKVYFFRLESKMFIEFFCFSSEALEHAAVQEDFLSVIQLQQMFGDGYGLRGTMK